VYNKSEKERAATFKRTAGRVRAKLLPSRASETPIPMHPTDAEFLQAPALLRGGWPLLCPPQHLDQTQTMAKVVLS
jgi:hypothetical protein